MSLFLRKRLDRADTFIANVQADPAVREAFASIGRGEEHFQKSRQLFDEARRLYQKQRTEYGEQYEATDELQAARQALKKRYMRHLDFARVCFRKDVSAQETLALNGPRYDAFPAWSGPVRDFYDGLLENPALQETAAAINIGKDEVNARRDELRAVVKLRQERKREAGEAEEATDARDEAFDALKDQMEEDYDYAPLLLADQPQKLEALGYTAP